MNILTRLKKIEANNPNKAPCFCNKTYWWSDKAFPTYCPRCKDKFDFWARLAAEAKNGENLTDLVNE